MVGDVAARSIGTAATDPRWGAALSAVIDEPERMTLFAQPIAELTSGLVAGFELLARFAGDWVATPDKWFAAAEVWNCNAALQARVLTGGIAMRSKLPPDTFLTINLDPHLLSAPVIADVLTSSGDMSRIVLELTEHTEMVESPVADLVLDQFRASGGLIAMDDAGTGFAGLSKLLRLRPDIVKLDRQLISGIDTDPVKKALAEVFGDLAGRMDAWILAEGIETVPELDTLIGLGVPLGQGFLLARPTPMMRPDLDAGLVAHIRDKSVRSSFRDQIVSLVRSVSCGRDRASCDVLLDADGRPFLVRSRKSGRSELISSWSPVLTVAPSATLQEVAQRAMSRPDADRFAPIVCTDGRGEVLGIVTVDDLLIGLSRSAQDH